MPDPQKRPQSPMAGFGQAIGLSAELVGITFLGFWLGYLLDRWLGTTLFIFLGLAIGAAGGFVRIWRSWRRT